MKVLINGMGSIGKRHFENFKNLGCETFSFSRRDSEYRNFSEAVEKLKPDYVVIATETSDHEASLKAILGFSEIKGILVEKPIFSDLPQTKFTGSDRIKVAYNLRFHPLVLAMKEKLGETNLVTWNSYVGQYLPDWRPGRDYRSIYSSQKSSGGGVLRDLSHEIDLFLYFAGDISLLSAKGGHFSSLETDTEDLYSLILKGDRCSHANIHMNCIDRLGQRFVNVSTNEESFFVDLVRGIWRDQDGEKSISFDRNASYMNMAKAFLQNSDGLCSFEEGLKILEIIKAAQRVS